MSGASADTGVSVMGPDNAQERDVNGRLTPAPPTARSMESVTMRRGNRVAAAATNASYRFDRDDDDFNDNRRSSMFGIRTPNQTSTAYVENNSNVVRSMFSQLSSSISVNVLAEQLRAYQKSTSLSTFPKLTSGTASYSQWITALRGRLPSVVYKAITEPAPEGNEDGTEYLEYMFSVYTYANQVLSDTVSPTTLQSVTMAPKWLMEEIGLKCVYTQFKEIQRITMGNTRGAALTRFRELINPRTGLKGDPVSVLSQIRRGLTMLEEMGVQWGREFIELYMFTLHFELRANPSEDGKAYKMAIQELYGAHSGIGDVDMDAVVNTFQNMKFYIDNTRRANSASRSSSLTSAYGGEGYLTEDAQSRGGTATAQASGAIGNSGGTAQHSPGDSSTAGSGGWYGSPNQLGACNRCGGTDHYWRACRQAPAPPADPPPVTGTANYVSEAAVGVSAQRARESAQTPGWSAAKHQRYLELLTGHGQQSPPPVVSGTAFFAEVVGDVVTEEAQSAAGELSAGGVAAQNTPKMKTDHSLAHPTIPQHTHTLHTPQMTHQDPLEEQTTGTAYYVCAAVASGSGEEGGSVSGDDGVGVGGDGGGSDSTVDYEEAHSGVADGDANETDDMGGGVVPSFFSMWNRTGATALDRYDADDAEFELDLSSEEDEEDDDEPENEARAVDVSRGDVVMKTGFNSDFYLGGVQGDFDPAAEKFDPDSGEEKDATIVSGGEVTDNGGGNECAGGAGSGCAGSGLSACNKGVNPSHLRWMSKDGDMNVGVIRNDAHLSSCGGGGTAVVPHEVYLGELSRELSLTQEYPTVAVGEVVGERMVADGICQTVDVVADVLQRTACVSVVDVLDGTACVPADLLEGTACVPVARVLKGTACVPADELNGTACVPAGVLEGTAYVPLCFVADGLETACVPKLEQLSG